MNRATARVRRPRSVGRLLAVGVGCAAVVLTACAGPPPVLRPPPSTSTAAPAPTTPASPSITCAPWDCTQQERFAAVEAYLRHIPGRHGYLSVVVTDRQTDARWRAGTTDHAGWTASTIKLAIAADLLAGDRAGRITLRDNDRHDIATMLNFSDEAASDRLWKAYGGDAMLDRIRSTYGMAHLRFVPGFTKSTYWGFLTCTADDLAALMRTVLDGPDRAYLVDALRGVAPNQQWGVWAAGAQQRPGNKDGWSFESDGYGKHWVADTVGFAGPDERYAVAIMYQVDQAGSLADGVHAVSDVAALLFGAPVPAPVTVPEPDG